ncbi:hypothetical protein [Limnoglobus roseus]|uniref:Uncharacterized protein n=1 Tax=Limnoglobus roseus TaxID=2598579 RepID=A0A5C1AB08_9BACT|nr:hypothetical protein [Limnoglobus roseus]QEL14314.1 hypothetical protein PX52LOC_01186 [Limnoglobus roseus]
MISSVGQSIASLYVSSVQQTTSASAAQATTGTSATRSAGDAAQISGPGKLFSELQQLSVSDPDKFKAVTADIAAKLKEAAGTDASSTAAAAAPGASSLLTDLAAKFQQASDTGDVSVLQPKAGGPGGAGGHHHHHHGVGTYNQQGQVQSVPAAQDTSSAGGVDLKSLFDSISQEVSSALGS